MSPRPCPPPPPAHSAKQTPSSSGPSGARITCTCPEFHPGLNRLPQGLCVKPTASAFRHLFAPAVPSARSASADPVSSSFTPFPFPEAPTSPCRFIGRNRKGRLAVFSNRFWAFWNIRTWNLAVSLFSHLLGPTLTSSDLQMTLLGGGSLHIVTMTIPDLLLIPWTRLSALPFPSYGNRLLSSLENRCAIHGHCGFSHPPGLPGSRAPRSRVLGSSREDSGRGASSLSPHSHTPPGLFCGAGVTSAVRSSLTVTCHCVELKVGQAGGKAGREGGKGREMPGRVVSA